MEKVYVVKIEQSYDLYLNHEKIPVQPVIINFSDNDSDVCDDASDRDGAKECDSDSDSDVSICL